MTSAKRALDEIRDQALGVRGVTGVGRDDGTIVALTRKPDGRAAAAVDEMARAPVSERVVGDVGATQTVPAWRTGGRFMDGCNYAFPAHDGQDAYVVSAYHCTVDLSPGDPVVAAGREVGEVTHVPEITNSPIPGAEIDVRGDWVAARIDNAQPIRDVERLDKPLSGEFYDPDMGEQLVKEGDRTGVSRGRVFAKDVSVVAPASISGYGANARIDHLIGVNTTVSPGDSGGPVMAEMNDHLRPVGTTYGGSPHASLFCTDMGHVKKQTGLQFGGEIPQVHDGANEEILGGEPPVPSGEAGPNPYLVLAGIGGLGALAFGITGTETPEWRDGGGS